MLQKPGFYRQLKFIISVVGLCASLLANAATVADLYEAEIPVQSQDRQERRMAIQQGLAEVLVRVSGQSDLVLSMPPLVLLGLQTEALVKTPNQPEIPQLALVGRTPGLNAALQHATHFARQFRYQKPTGKPHMDWGIVWGKQKRPKQKKVQQVLWIKFNEKKINNLLQNSGIPVWGKTRPSTLLWLAVDNGGRRYLLSTNVTSVSRSLIEKAAQLTGLPIRLPLMDLADRANISTSDVWGNFEDTILKASKRYQTEAVLVGRVYKLNRMWQTRWTLYLNGRRQDWEATKSLLRDAIQPGVGNTAQALARAFAHVQGNTEVSNVLVEIRDVAGLSEYNRTMKYLTSLSAVSKVQTLQVKAKNIIFELTTRGSRVNVIQAIALGDRLVAEPNTVPRQSEAVPTTEDVTQTDKLNQISVLAPDLVYRLLP